MNVKDIGKNIELLNIIGKGSYGNVYLGLNNLNNQYYAIKVISKSQLQSRIVYQYFNNEIYILKHINHPNIVKYISLVEQKKDYWLVIEYCNGGSLVKALKYVNELQFSNILYIDKTVDVLKCVSDKPFS